MTAPVYFDDLVPGSSWTTAGRTVTETDVVSFAGLSGDYNRLHVDAEFAATTPFGERVAHGLLVLSVASGLSTRLAVSEAMAPNILGLLDLQCRWPGPTRFGDTIHVVLTIEDCRATSRPGRGVVTMTREVVNQRGETVMVSTWKLLVRARDGA
ncbi:acyl dehydratase [Pseudonocardia sp. EC080610-09]|uniref:MaoC/PaaZ C-terminal domain-containing protein n=1 Tax=unclassified Pseudonocardia TaxID=2619320 RepID=UPI0006CB727E|nr:MULTISPECIES: MaoC/PaaZ C-terminal domain-containing protein [unclassified Pseudonocardia]ALE73507.1 acyl dehydratase [Pseudonocardia sp. EC080625-04]ALL76968.1 acyl dehydratase [Pseudonocardia sp. EC080610-09]ALL83999.1 acyl dehydratase [Pseudonocardia sp. EC080619-01]